MIFTVCKQYINFSIWIENNTISALLIRENKVVGLQQDWRFITYEGSLQAIAP